MRIFRTQLPLVASCTLLGAIPTQIAKANEPRGLQILLTDAAAPVLVAMTRLRLDSAAPILDVPDNSPTTVAPDAPRSGEPSALPLRMDDDYAQRRSARDGAAGERRDAAADTLTLTKSRSLSVLAGYTLMHDSNVFRLPANVDPRASVGVPSKSDTIHVAMAGLRFDKDYAQQRIELEITETVYRYTDFSFFNFEALEWRGAWHWHITPRWRGTVATERRVTSAASADTEFSRRNQRNLRTSDNYRLALDGSLFGGWHVLLGAFQNQVKYDQGFLPQNSSRSRGGEAGIQYASAAGSAITLMQRVVQGEYLNRPLDAASFSDNAFGQQELELKLDWQLTGKSVLHGRLAHLDVRHDNFVVRDFSGVIGELSYVWMPTGKLRLEALARRDRSAWWQTFSSYRIDDTLSLVPAWQVGAKTTARLRLERVHSNFRGPVFVPTGPLRTDTLHNVQLGVEWLALRGLTLDANLQRLKRSSNTPEAAFDTTIASVNAKLTF